MLFYRTETKDSHAPQITQGMGLGGDRTRREAHPSVSLPNHGSGARPDKQAILQGSCLHGKCGSNASKNSYIKTRCIISNYLKFSKLGSLVTNRTHLISLRYDEEDREASSQLASFCGTEGAV